MIQVTVTPEALEYMPNLSREFTIYKKHYGVG